MKLDPTVMRTMNKQDFRVLAAVETGMKDHALVPLALITSIANLRHGGTNKITSSLLRDKLLSHDQSCGYDGYRVTNSGYDVLALHNLKSRGVIAGLGDRIGTGKESDVYLAVTPRNTQIVLKLHRLGRTSFRDVKKKRDYFATRDPRRGRARPQPNSWLFLSRASALKEYAFMKALHDAGYATPAPVAQNRHAVAMGLVRGVPLYQLHPRRVSADQAQSIFEQSAALAGRLARHGLVHCDLNEFNLMVDLSGVQAKIAAVGDANNEDGLAVEGDKQGREWEDDATEHYVRHSGMPVRHKGALSSHGPLQKHSVDGTGEIVTEKPPEPAERLENGDPKPIVTLIDFPQMVSTRHPNARELYERDVVCLKKFFGKKLRCYVDGEGRVDEDRTKTVGIMPSWEELIAETGGGMEAPGNDRLDEELQASGYSKEDAARGSEFAYYESHQQLNRDLNVLEDVVDENTDDEGASKDELNEFPEKNMVDITKNKELEISECLDDDDQVPELIDIGEFQIESNASNNNDGASIAGVVSIGGLSQRSQLSHAEAEHVARERVRRHLEDRKRASGKRGAFKSRNSNKSYAKGKRVLTDFDL